MKNSFLILIFISFLIPISVDSSSKTLVQTSTTTDDDFFPLGIYWVLNSTDILNANANGFNTMLFGYDLLEAFEMPIEDMLDTCDQENISVIFELSYFLRNEAIENFTQFLPDLIPHPSIYAWYLIDEPYSYINDTDILELKALINQYDSRPTFVQFSNQFIERPDDYTLLPGEIDYLSVDPYPRMPYVNHSIVTERLQALDSYNQNQSTRWVVLTAQGRNDSYYEIPTENEFRMDIVSAMQFGVKGMHWFTYGEYDSPYFGVNTDPEAWNIIGELINEIKPVTKLLLTQVHRSKIYEQGNLSYSVITNSTHKLVALTNQNYYWNGTETMWNSTSEDITLPDGEIVSITLEDSAALIILEISIVEIEPILLPFLLINTWIITIFIRKFKFNIKKKIIPQNLLSKNK